MGNPSEQTWPQGPTRNLAQVMKVIDNHNVEETNLVCLLRRVARLRPRAGQ